MESYVSKSGKPSGIIAYEMGDDYIEVQFKTNPPYKYTNDSAGKEMVAKMKQLALDQQGLSAYIAKHKPAVA